MISRESLSGRRFAADRFVMVFSLFSHSSFFFFFFLLLPSIYTLFSLLSSLSLSFPSIPPSSIAKHQKVCKGPSEMKTHTTDLPPPPSASSKPKGKPQWQKDHEAFIQAMRAAKQVAKYEKEGRLNELPPPPPDPHDDYKQCPHCGRRFAPLSYDRHVPKWFVTVLV